MEALQNGINPYTATCITIGLIAFLLIVVPLCERIPWIGECVSRRWVVVAIITTLMVAVVIDFSHLENSIRMAIIVGGFIIGGAYILVRSLEKAMANGWSLSAGKLVGNWSQKSVTIEDVKVEKEKDEPKTAEEGQEDE
jgi:hypothetical protein